MMDVKYMTFSDVLREFQTHHDIGSRLFAQCGEHALFALPFNAIECSCELAMCTDVAREPLAASLVLLFCTSESNGFLIKFHESQ